MGGFWVMRESQKRYQPFSGQGYGPFTASLNNIPFHRVYVYNTASLIEALWSWQCNKFVQLSQNFKIAGRSQPAHSFSVLKQIVASPPCFFPDFFPSSNCPWHSSYGLWDIWGIGSCHHPHITTSELRVTRICAYPKLTQLRRGCHSFQIVFFFFHFELFSPLLTGEFWLLIKTPSSGVLL